MRAAVGDAGECGDELRVVARVGPRLAGVARALHARRAGERANADAGVVGQRRQAGERTRVPRLGERVLDEGDVRLGRLGDAEFRLRDHLDAERRQQAAELAQLALVAGREDEARKVVHRRSPPPTRLRRALTSAARPAPALRGDQVRDALLGQRDQRVHLGARERRALGGALDLDEAADPGHHDVHVGVADASPRRSRGRAPARRRPCPPTRRRRSPSAARRSTPPCALHQAIASATATQAPVIDAQRVPPSACSTSQSMRIVRSPSAARSVTARRVRPIRRWISCVRPDCRPSAASRRDARVGRARQHAVFGGEPALPLALEERRHALLDARRAQHRRVAGLDQHRALGVLRELPGDAQRAQLVGAAAGRTRCHRGSFRSGCAAIIAGVGRHRPCLTARGGGATSARSRRAPLPASPRHPAGRRAECRWRRPRATVTSRRIASPRPASRAREHAAAAPARRAAAPSTPSAPAIARTRSGAATAGASATQWTPAAAPAHRAPRRRQRRDCRRRAGCASLGSAPSGSDASPRDGVDQREEIGPHARPVDQRQAQHDRRERGARGDGGQRLARPSSLLRA